MEEKWGYFAWKAATVYAALVAAARFARVFYHREGQEVLSDAAANLNEAMQKHLYDHEEHRFIRAIYDDGSRDWVVKHSLHSGVLAEQINPHTGAPLSVSPLIWSHA